MQTPEIVGCGFLFNSISRNNGLTISLSNHCLDVLEESDETDRGRGGAMKSRKDQVDL